MNRLNPFRPGLFAAALFFVGLILCLCVAGLLLAFSLLSQERDAVRSRYGERIAAMCQQPDMAGASLANLPVGEGLRALVLVSGESLRDPWHNRLPAELRADSPDSLDVVICLDKRQRPPNSPCAASHLPVAQRPVYLELRAFNAATGAAIVQLEVVTEAPELCPDAAGVLRHRYPAADEQAFVTEVRALLEGRLR